MLKAIEPKRQYEACDECDGRMVAYNVAEFAASYTQSNADAIDDETGLDCLYAVACETCQDNGVILTASSREFGFDHAKCPDCK